MLLLEVNLTLIFVLCIIVPIFALIIVATVIALVKRIKMAKKYSKKNKNKVEVDEELKKALLEAFGEDNIEKVESEMSRLTITVKDVDIVKTDVLKELGANGVLLVGNMVKCSFGEKAKEIEEILK